MAIKITRGPGYKGLEKVMVKMDPLVMQTVKAIAIERAMARGQGRIDSSEIIREAVEFWLQRKGK